jgi:rhodanese-related sulfurtransferase
VKNAGSGYTTGVSDGAGKARLEPIDATELAERVERGDAVLIDVRRETGSEQIYGAIRYDPRLLLEASRLRLPLPKSRETPLVLYDETGDGPDLEPVGAKFRLSGYAAPLRLTGGFNAWRAAARRTEEPSLELPVPTDEDLKSRP